MDARSSLLSADDVYLFNEGTHYRLYDHLGARVAERGGRRGVAFGVWAPNAARVSVVGDFNGWTPREAPLAPVGGSGVWEGFVEGLGEGAVYKYHVESAHDGYRVDKMDPFGFRHERAPNTASIVWGLDYAWGDSAWMGERGERQRGDRPISIYEVHLGSWKRSADGRRLTYSELAEELPGYVSARGFTHVELMPVMEHPLYRSWGYQTTGYFAPTSRYGTPQEFMGLVDRLHQAGIGVILDWVPSHFPSDEHALGYFDGTHLFEHADPRLGFHPDWKSLIFNYGRHEVRAFLISSAMFWLDRYHADGIRVDAVASMLYRDYSREEGEWIPNEFGGRESLEAIDFLRRMNSEIHRVHPEVLVFAEESTSWEGVTRPVAQGGLGFDYKWDMGWMHDTLKHLSRDPIHRAHHHTEMTFRGLYMFSERYLLPLSHDEVVHLKGSLYGRMPGDDWRKRATVRLLLAHQWTQPGKKLLFMGGEFAQRGEWDHGSALEWGLLEEGDGHAGILRLVDDLNRLYRGEAALHERDDEAAGFEWLDADDAGRSLLSYVRRGAREGDAVVVLANLTPVVREGVWLGVPRGGVWEEVLNTDSAHYGGSGVGNLGRVESVEGGVHGHAQRIEVTAPPLGAVVFRHSG